jgi:site-specific DNA-methyltransferase (adenine-specific)
MELNKVHNQDCIVGMQEIPDRFIDLILCDLPYGVLKHKSNPNTYWDVIIPPEKLWEQYRRILKPRGAVILTAIQPFATDLINSNRAWFRYELIWCKSRASGFLNAKKRPSSAHENILVFYQNSPEYHPQKYSVPERFIERSRAKRNSICNSKAFKIRENEDYSYVDDGSRYPDTLLEFQSVSRKGMHPTEKPVDLFAWLIRSFTKQGDVVLDNCMGSGTTAIAAILEGRNFIGFEKDYGYFSMCERRIMEIKNERNLVLGP